MEQFVGKVLCGTGHRPNSFGGYKPWVEEMLLELAIHVLTKLKPKGVITGMAQGWDMALADACLRLKIPYLAAIPFEGQELRWSVHGIYSQTMYWRLRQAANKVKVVTPQVDRTNKSSVIRAMHIRNEWMVHNSEFVLALWNGYEKGGTWKCVYYARGVNKPVVQCWDKLKMMNPTRFKKECSWCGRWYWLEEGVSDPLDLCDPCRPIPTQVVHCKKEYFDIYIGRGKGGDIPTTPGEYGYYGNPIVKGKTCPFCKQVHETGGSTLPCYRKYLEDRMNSDPKFKDLILNLKGKVLGCWCSPGPCHGDVISQLLEEY